MRGVRLRRVGLFVVGACGVLYGAVVASGALWARAPVEHQTCPVAGAVVQVDTAARVLSLCRNGREDGSFRVALGRGGVDKRVEGDGRTPRGRYTLSPARASSRFHLFLPVGYPTPEQTSKGFSGSAIGLHGPHVGFAWLRNATAWSDWTLGCVAVPTRAAIETVAAWVSANDVSEVIIL